MDFCPSRLCHSLVTLKSQFKKSWSFSPTLPHNLTQYIQVWGKQNLGPSRIWDLRDLRLAIIYMPSVRWCVLCGKHIPHEFNHVTTPLRSTRYVSTIFTTLRMLFSNIYWVKGFYHPPRHPEDNGDIKLVANCFWTAKIKGFSGAIFWIEFNICFASHSIVPVKCVHISPLQSLVYRRFFEWSQCKKEMWQQPC